MPRPFGLFKKDIENWNYSQTIYIPNWLLEELEDSNNKSLKLRFFIESFLEEIENIDLENSEPGVKTITLSIDRNTIKKIYKKYLKPRFFLSFSEFMRIVIFWYIIKGRPEQSLKNVKTSGDVLEIDGKEYILQS